MKSEPYEALLRLTEGELKELFPFGASSTAKDRWGPAEEGKADKTLRKLLRDKKAREETPLFMAQSGPQRLRWSSKQKKWVPKEFEGTEEHGYTKGRHRALCREDVEIVPAHWQAKFDKEAETKRNTQAADELLDRQARVIANKLAKLQREGARLGLDFGPGLREFVRGAQDEIVRLRKEAA